MMWSAICHRHDDDDDHDNRQREIFSPFSLCVWLRLLRARLQAPPTFLRCARFSTPSTVSWYAPGIKHRVWWTGGQAIPQFLPGWLLSWPQGWLWQPACQQERRELSAQMMHGRGLGRQLVVGHSPRRRQPLRPLLPSPQVAVVCDGSSSSCHRPAEVHSVNT